MESSHFLTISSPWQKLRNVVLRILICCHGNEIWAIFAKISNCFFFVFRWNRAIFWPLVLRDPLYKTLFFDFWLWSPNPQNWLPKIWQKIAYNSACMAIDRRCLHLTGGFRDGRFNGTMQNVVGPTLVAMATKFGLKSPITRIVRQIGRRCFDLLWDFRGWPIQCNHAKSCRADPCCHGNDIWARRGV